MGADKAEKEFDNFRELARKIVAVPKSEVKELEEKLKKNKRRSTNKRRATRTINKRK